MHDAWNQVNDAGILIDLLLAADTDQGCWWSRSQKPQLLLAARQWRFQHASILNHKQTYSRVARLSLRESGYTRLKQTLPSFGQIDICIKLGKFPWVTHAKELCKPYLELLMGRIYAKHATKFCIILDNMHSLHLSSWERFMQKSKRVNTSSFSCNWLYMNIITTYQQIWRGKFHIVYCFCINPFLV